jgi:hypothetical protein
MSARLLAGVLFLVASTSCGGVVLLGNATDGGEFADQEGGSDSSNRGGTSGHGGSVGAGGTSGAGGASGSGGTGGSSGSGASAGSGGSSGSPPDAGMAQCAFNSMENTCFNVTRGCWDCVSVSFYDPACPATTTCPNKLDDGKTLQPGWACLSCTGGLAHQYVCNTKRELVADPEFVPLTCPQ